ncbi:MAG: response regulator [Phycisphaerae bacterium]|jgi:RNA polymerase sigma factor (sigma-70 family)
MAETPVGPPSPGTVFILDEDEAVRDSLRSLVRIIGLPVKASATATEFLDEYDPTEPSCLVLGIHLPGMSGIDLHETLVERGLSIPVIIVTGLADVPLAVDAMRRGALDFLEKPVQPQKLLDRIQEALSLDAERCQSETEREAISERAALLTAREREVVELAVTGLTNKQIAARLGVSSQAIDAHRARALRKMDVASVPELVTTMIKLHGS